jgi:prepilin-type N-terminal cleavage/methylation domain-containing protein
MNKAGFSLVEVMVAILVLGIALVGLTHGITTALGSAKESELQTTAALFAAGKIESLRAEGLLVDGESDGECGEGLSLYRWRQSVNPTDLDGLHEIVVTVENAASGRSIYELRTLLFEIPSDSTTKDRDAKSRKQQNRKS